MARSAVIAHGSGSTADLVHRAFAEPLAEAGLDLVALEDRTGDVATVADQLAAAVDDLGAVLVGGISLGAHAAVRVAATRPHLEGVLAVMPAWTHRPEQVAALSAAAAQEIEREGLPAVVASLAGQGWVGEEIALAWPSYGQQALIGALRATAASHGPGLRSLLELRPPLGIVALDGDAFHPLDVALRWAQITGRASLAMVDAAEVAADRAALGRAAVRAWRAAQGSKR